MDLAWRVACDAVSSLAAAASGVVASVVIAAQPCLVGIDADGRLRWRTEVSGSALLVAGGRSVFAAIGRRIMAIDPLDGSVGAVREIDPPAGGWAPATTLAIGDELLIAGAAGLERMGAPGLGTRWKLSLALDDVNDTIQQLASAPPSIAAVSNHAAMLIAGRGELVWKQPLPADSRLAGDRPLALAGHRILVGLVEESAPQGRYLRELGASDGMPLAATRIDDLAMFCPAHAADGVLVLDTQRGLAGFDIGNGLRRLWSVEAPVAMGSCLPRGGDLLVATRDGELLRVACADGRVEVLMRLPRKQAWVPPAPDLAPGGHSESMGAIDHLVSLPDGIALSVAWPGGHAAIEGHRW
jgi:hypothetical protein